MKIEEILENEVIASFNYLEEYDDLINHYVLFNDGKNIVGEIVNIKGNKLTIKLIGEIKNNDFIYGVSSKPSNGTEISIIKPEASNIITSYPESRDSLYIGNIRVSQLVSDDAPPVVSCAVADTCVFGRMHPRMHVCEEEYRLHVMQ